MSNELKSFQEEVYGNLIRNRADWRAIDEFIEVVRTNGEMPNTWIHTFPPVEVQEREVPGKEGAVTTHPETLFVTNGSFWAKNNFEAKYYLRSLSDMGFNQVGVYFTDRPFIYASDGVVLLRIGNCNELMKKKDDDKCRELLYETRMYGGTGIDRIYWVVDVEVLSPDGLQPYLLERYAERFRGNNYAVKTAKIPFKYSVLEEKGI